MWEKNSTILQEMARMQSTKNRSERVERETVLLTESKLANTDMMNKGTVLKKHTRARKRNPVNFFLASSPSDLFMFSQI